MSNSHVSRLVCWALALAVVAVPLVGLFAGWFAGDHWPVRSLRIDGQFRHVSAEEVRDRVTPLLAKGFFATDLQAVQQHVAALPWVARVEVRKHWPDEVRIRVLERNVVARWNRTELLARDGTVFAAPGVEHLVALPHLGGPPGSGPQVLAFYRQAHRRFEAIGLDVTAVALSRRGSWRLQLGNGGIVTVGKVTPQARLARFVAGLDVLLDHRDQVFLSADLRYSNGFAMRWLPSRQIAQGHHSS